MPQDHSEINLTSIITAAQAAGKVIRGYFGQTLEIEEKSTLSDFRTKADTESERAILQILTKEYPSFNIFSEEAGLIDKKSEHTFIIDPLDGSNNFVLGIPNFSVSIGLLKGERAVAGVIHIPTLNHTYYAQEGQGSFMGEIPLHVNDEPNIKKATVSYTAGYGHSQEYAEGLRHRVRQLGIKRLIEYWSPAVEYCLLASGKLEAIINNKNDIYDFLAGKIIAREAGAKITGFNGKPEQSDRGDNFLVSNGMAIHEEILAVI